MPSEEEVEELIQLAGTLSGYFIQRPAQVPDNEFVDVCNGDLRKVHEWLLRNGRNPLQERADKMGKEA